MNQVAGNNGHRTVDARSIMVDTPPPQVRVGIDPGNTGTAAAAAQTIGNPRPDLSGYRLQIPGQAPIYLIDPNGYARWIPNPQTYNNLFVNWNGVVADIDLNEIAKGPQLTNGASLAKGDAAAQVYLLDQGMKRWITSPAVMAKYYFNWARVVVVPQVLIDSIPPGPDWT